jgi:hypothetical protein
MKIPLAFLELLSVIDGRKNKAILIDAPQGREHERGERAYERTCRGMSERVK